MDEVDVDAVDIGDELGQSIQPRFDLAPVVLVRPIVRELLHRRELHALRCVTDEFLVRPLCRGDPPLQVRECLVGRSLKANLVVLSPETRDLPRQLKRQLNLDLTMLSDVDYGVAISYGVLFRVPDEAKAHYAGLGYDLGQRHGSTEWMLPIPATYVIDQDGVVRGAFVEPDYTIRQEPSDILAKVRQLAGSQAEDASASDE